MVTTRKDNGIIAKRDIHNEEPEPNKIPVEVSEEEYEVERIIQARKIKGKLHYLVRWAGYADEDDTWEPADNILDVSVIRNFNDSKGESRNSDSEIDVNRVTVKKRKSAKKAPKLTKKLLIEESRKSRIESRKSLAAPNNIPHFCEDFDDLCCLVCSSRIFSNAITSGSLSKPNMKSGWKANSQKEIVFVDKADGGPSMKTQMLTGNALFDKAVQATSKVAGFEYASPPDCIAENALSLALEKNLIDHIRAIYFKKASRAEPSVELLKGAGSGTGFVSKNTFRHAVKTVNESRGNREGNTAFFKYANKDTMQLHRVKYNRSASIKEETILDCLRKKSLSSQIVTDIMCLSTYNNFMTECCVYEAASAGDLSTVSALLNSIGDYEGFNHLHREIAQNKEYVSLTSYKTTQITKKATSNKQIRPIHFAAIHPSSDYLNEFYGQIPINDFNIEDGVGRKVSHYAAVSSTAECLKYLIEKKIDINSFDSLKVTPFILCAMHGRVHNLSLFIKCLGKDIVNQKQTKNGWTALHFAARYGHIDMVSALIDLEADVTVQDRESKASALHHAVKFNHIDVVKALIQKGNADPELQDKFGRTPLHLAAKNGRFDICHYLLKEIGVDSDIQDTSENTPLHYASAFGWSSIINLLITVGLANVNSANNWKTTPMAIADMKGHRDIVNQYLDNPKVDASFKNQSGQTLLHIYAAAAPYDLYEAHRLIGKTKRLLNREMATLSVADSNGDTPLHILAASPHYVKGVTEVPDISNKFLKDKHHYEKMKANSKIFGNFDEVYGTQMQLQLASLCLNDSSDVNARNRNKKTALEVAMENDHVDMVIFLLKYAKDSYSTCRYGESENNLMHFILRQVALIQYEIYNVQTIESNENCRISRYQTKISTLWDFLMVDLSLNNPDLTKKLLDLPNKIGHTPLIDSVIYANKLRDEIVSELESKVTYRNYSPIENEAFDIDFDWSYFTEFVTKVIKATSPNLDYQIKLPMGRLSSTSFLFSKNEPEYTGWGVLHLSTSFAAYKLVDTLLSLGANPNLISWGYRDGFSPLFLCIKPRELSQRLIQVNLNQNSKLIKYSDPVASFKTMLENFIKSGVDLTLIPTCPANSYDTKKELTLLYQCSLLLMLFENNTAEILQGFIKQCQKLYQPEQFAEILSKPGNKHRQNLLSVCILGNQINKLQIILELPSNLNCTDQDGNTALMHAVKSKNTQILHKLLSFGANRTTSALNLSFVNKERHTVLTLAGEFGNAYTMKLLFYQVTQDSNINHRDPSGKTALYWACHHNSTCMVQKLIECGADVNIPCCPITDQLKPIKLESLTPLTAAIINHTPQCNKIVQLLLLAGADPNVANSFGNTPLHLIAPRQDFKTMQLLLENGASPKVVNFYLMSPLHLAVISSLTVVDRTLRQENLLIKYGADINAVDFQGRTALHICFSISGVIPYMKHTACQKFFAEKAAASIRSIKENKFKIESQLKDLGLQDRTEMKNYLIQNNSLPILRTEKDALTPGFDIEWFKSSAYQTLNWESGFKNILKDDPIELVDFFINSKNIRVDVKDSFKRTPLHYAARVGALASSTRLIEQHANLDSLDYDELSPFNLALLYGHVDLAVSLFNRGVDGNRKMKIPHQKDISPFSFVLSQSYMPLAFMIIEKKMGFIGSIKDALNSGKFSFAYNLMLQADSSRIKSIEPDSLHNFAHAISGFNPSNKSTWSEHLPDFLNKVTQNQISITIPDKNGSTPLILASQNNQLELVTQLLKMNSSTSYINHVDLNGQSALWHALNKSSVNIVTELLKYNILVDSGEFKNNESVLCLCVNRCPNLVASLIKKGAQPNIDSKYGRCSAFMSSLFTSYPQYSLSRIKIWKHLFDAKADFNIQGNIDFNQAHKENIYFPQAVANKIKSISIHPIFFIFQFSLEEQSLLFQFGLSPNAYHPISGVPAVSLCDNQTQLETFLKHGADLNIIDQTTNQPFFYKVLFKKLNFNLNCPIYSWKPLWNSLIKVNFNIIDPVTGQSPLEYAIHLSDFNLLEILLKSGADPSMKSGLKKLNKNTTQYNAINHAIHSNNYMAFSIILKHCKREGMLNTLIESDSEFNRNSLFYTVQLNSVVSYQNTTILEKILEYLKDQRFDINLLAHQKDTSGKSPIQYAAMRQCKDMYNVFGKAGCQFLSDKEANSLQNLYKTSSIELNSIDEENLDFISVEKLEDDAAKAEVMLQSKLPKENKADNLIKSEAKLVDQFSDQKGTGVIAKGPDGKLLTVLLNKTEFINSSYTKNVFYKLQLIFNPLQEIYILFTRWGGIGETGMYQKTPFSTYDLGFKEFENVFKSKTSNAWSCRNTDKFLSFPKKYRVAQIVEKKPILKIQEIIKEDFQSKLIPSLLPNGVRHLMAIFRNITIKKYSQPDVSNLIPLGQRDQFTINQAKKYLELIKQSIEEVKVLSAAFGKDANLKSLSLAHHKLLELNSQYYTLIPQVSNNQINNIDPIVNLCKWTEEALKLENLMYLQNSANMLLASLFNSSTIHPLDYCYRALNCQLKHISSDDPWFDLVKKNMCCSDQGIYDLVSLYQVRRIIEETRFKPFENSPGRMLLWHGTKLSNYLGVLSQGLRVAPIQAATSGYMFGKGIYFADSFQKSINYCSNFNSNSGSNEAKISCLLLCEVAVGNFYPTLQAEHMLMAKEGFTSTKGVGKKNPNPLKTCYLADGTAIPSEELVESAEYNTLLEQIKKEQKHYQEYKSLQFNEYVVYDETRVKIRAIAVIKKKNVCHFCSKIAYKTLTSIILPENLSNLKSILLKDSAQHAPFVSSSSFKRNKIEQLLTDILIRKEGLDSAEFILKYMDKYCISANSVIAKFKEPILPYDPKISPVCESCFAEIINLIYTEYLLENQENVPKPFQSRKLCPYGFKCLNQSENSHAVAFNHCCHPTKPLDNFDNENHNKSTKIFDELHQNPKTNELQQTFKFQKNSIVFGRHHS